MKLTGVIRMLGLKHEVAIAGHICLDIIPEITNGRVEASSWLVPGRLNNVGPAIIATGGAVTNTGIALNKLGVRVKLLGKIGDDLFGKAILDKCQSYDGNLTDHMIISKGEVSSYTIVISSKKSDRIFLHCPGTNDTFSIQDLPFHKLKNITLFHFGYPPLMRNMYMNNGEMLSQIFQRVKSEGIMTSLDMAMPDKESESGKVNWRNVLKKTLPYVDFFLPSIEEILYMLRQDTFHKLQEKYGSSKMVSYIDGNLLSSVAEELIQMGAKTVVLKLGEQGLYIRTTQEKVIKKLLFFPEDVRMKWSNREFIMPSYKVNVQGTTGAGDCTIAGFITGLLQKLSPEETLRGAVAVGGYNVEKADATSGIVSWEKTTSRIKRGWEQQSVKLPLNNWQFNKETNIWIGPYDRLYNNEKK